MGLVRSIRVVFISILVLTLATFLSQAGRTASPQPERDTSGAFMPSQASPALVAEYHGSIPNSSRPEKWNLHSSGGIREQVPEKYAARYQRWKEEFLATETGRQ